MQIPSVAQTFVERIKLAPRRVEIMLGSGHLLPSRLHGIHGAPSTAWIISSGCGKVCEIRRCVRPASMLMHVCM